MKKRTIVLAIAALMLATSLPFAAKAQDPFKNLTDNGEVASYKVPNITEFVTGYLNNPEDEHLGYLNSLWKKHLNHQAIDKNEKVTVDSKNGFVCFESGPDESGFTSITEMCYWNCSDGLHKLFAENVNVNQNGKPVFTEFTGLYIYAYDNATQKLYLIDQELIGITDEVRGEVTFKLPRQGKDIDVLFSDGTQKKLTWNGKGFNKVK